MSAVRNCGTVFQKVWVTADLTHSEQGVEDGNLRALNAAFGNRIPHAGVHGHTDRLVERLLLGSQRDQFGDLGLGGQIKHNLILGAA